MGCCYRNSVLKFTFNDIGEKNNILRTSLSNPCYQNPFGVLFGSILDRFWGEKAYYNRAKDQIEFLGKQKKPYYDGIVSALQYVALYEPEKLILEEYEIARTLFDNDSKFNRPTALQVISTAFLLFRLIVFSVYCNRSAVKYGWSDLYSISISNCFWSYQKMFRFWTKD